jgi:hypothetical protein
VSCCGRIQTWRKLKVQLGQNEGDRFLFRVFVLSDAPSTPIRA